MKINLNELRVFSEVVRHLNFTKTAKSLGMTQSAVSQTIGNLEKELGIRLFNRSTRSLTLTQAGEQLSNIVDTPLIQITQGVEQLKTHSHNPSGLVRISADAYVHKYYIWDKIKPLLAKYPDIQIDLTSDNARIDIAKEGYDAGVRLGNLIDLDMVAVPISEDIQMCLVASPKYLEQHHIPVTIEDLKQHQCIHIRLLTDNSLLGWTFIEDNKQVVFKGRGQVIMSNIEQILEASLCGFGIAYLPMKLVAPYLKNKKLISVLPEYCITHPPFYLFYTSRKLMSPAFKLVKEALTADLIKK
ncbi:DNA-binding transcriptional regulator, LysR family [Acinetobacter marinus]|uniref:DNA-binding transcriptional regulator, LysR family n=1 Tax=Acinetobacter marinus TaxID=281375 RepID=A0A1G6GY25_9GAMM|nr:LysR family transcriptional regulator [Acinetobacter marinus]SDB86937.1 DNA-binding transcriptional regulator, LysR family [Acinetobacter marinus]